MKTYACIVDGRISEIIPQTVNVEGVDVDIAERYSEDFIAGLVLIPDGVAVEPGYGADFKPFVQPAPTPEQNAVTRDNLMAAAAVAIAPLQDAVDLDVATGEEHAKLTQWKQYRVALSRVSLDAPEWPELPA